MKARRCLIWLLVLVCVLGLPRAVGAEAAGSAEFRSRSALLMDIRSGQVLKAHNPDEPLPPASLTKIMTLALVFEAVSEGRAAWSDRVAASDLAASMGGSQIWLVPGEVMSLGELALAIALASANDASVAAAEHVSGSFDAFMTLMNERAAALGMRNASFLNPHGLDEDGHLMSARDVALASRYAARQPGLLEMTVRWDEYLRDGQTWLVNTNRLLKSVPGADGLKTGSTSGAGYCVSVTARRDETRLVAVIMGAPDSQTRFDEARQLINYGFSAFESIPLFGTGETVATVTVDKGRQSTVTVITAHEFAVTVARGQKLDSPPSLDLPTVVRAPVVRGQAVGFATVAVPGGEVMSVPLVAADDVPRARFRDILGRVFIKVLGRFR